MMPHIPKGFRRSVLIQHQTVFTTLATREFDRNNSIPLVVFYHIKPSANGNFIGALYRFKVELFYRGYRTSTHHFCA
jgi:hypothetical protein